LEIKALVVAQGQLYTKKYYVHMNADADAVYFFASYFEF